jgi:predicted N-acetyltransferase YhbS/nitroimidazol reductase NimA-like FMN-containing flavoprotein (pyridoxamine 5'-phosphate oxidase superfamily)
MRRQEFARNDLQAVQPVLDGARIGHLAYLRDGEVELLPYNFVNMGSRVYVHTSPKTGLASAVGDRIKFLAYNNVAWIPSTWRHPELACPATTYYASVSFSSILEEVTDLVEKADVLEAFMKKYQSESYKPLRDEAYHGPLKALLVGSLKVENPACKLKMGQNLTAKHRERVYRGLRHRALLGDRQVAHAMTLANEDCGEEGWVEELTDAQTAQLTSLLAETYWAGGRTVADQARLNQQSHLVLAKCDGNRVLAFVRVALLNTRSAYMGDVIVHPDHRGNGLGNELMRRLFEHPRIQEIGRFMLVTKTAQTLYEKFGFETKFETDTSFMVREPAPLYAG